MKIPTPEKEVLPQKKRDLVRQRSLREQKVSCGDGFGIHRLVHTIFWLLQITYK